MLCRELGPSLQRKDGPNESPATTGRHFWGEAGSGAMNRESKDSACSHHFQRFLQQVWGSRHSSPRHQQRRVSVSWRSQDRNRRLARARLGRSDEISRQIPPRSEDWNLEPGGAAGCRRCCSDYSRLSTMSIQSIQPAGHPLPASWNRLSNRSGFGGDHASIFVL